MRSAPNPEAVAGMPLTIAAANEVRLSVAYLGYNQAVEPPGGQFKFRLPPLHLPSLIP